MSRPGLNSPEEDLHPIIQSPGEVRDFYERCARQSRLVAPAGGRQ